MLPPATLDAILTLQLAVAEAGEAGEAGDEDEPRLGWWKTDLTSHFGGRALFKRLAPRTADWACLEAAREAAIRADAQQRSADANPDQLRSLFHLGFEIDEQLQDRLRALKQAGDSPKQALPRLAELPKDWSAEAFAAWLGEAPAPKTKREPSGLRVVGEAPDDAGEQARALAAVLAELPERYPCPHYRDARAS